jgi:HD-GYP domain-containing protein (c-di-GMP phosphodiesterase class II)
VAQIVGIVDTYEALTAPRPYQQAVPPEGAFTVLRQHVRRGWKRDDLVDTIISVVERLHAGDAS